MRLSLTGLIRNPAESSQESPLLVLLHGLGSNEQDLMGLAPELDPELRIVALRAPFAYGGMGYAWFSIDWTPDGIQVNTDQARQSIDTLIEDLEALQLEFSPSKLFLGGFSQGAIMSFGVSLRRPDLLDGVLLLSGRDVPEFYATGAADIQGKPYLVQHGTEDTVLPIEGARDLRATLERLGADVTYHEYPMGHTIDEDSLADLNAWLSPRL